jgi:hypothetical protein
MGEFEAPEQIPSGIVMDGTSSSSAFPAGSDLFVPLRVQPAPPDHPGVTPTPANHVTIRYLSPTGTRSVHVAWEPSLTVQRLFARARLQDSIFKHVPVFKFARVIGRRRVKLNHYLQPGDVLELNSSDKPFR